MQKGEDVTALLHAAGSGDQRAFDQLYAMAYQELRRLAHNVRSGRGAQTLNTTALVHEAYIKLAASKNPAWVDRVHFLRIAARAMRQVLIDAAQRRTAQKRGGKAIPIEFDERVHSSLVDPESLLALEDALKQLEAVDERQAQVVECRFFGGLTIEETALALGVSDSSVKRDWRTARAWLGHTLKSV
ncbi:MAG: ECF-type sigma factor [Rhodothermales bacterium]